MFDIDDLIMAREERRALWDACCRHEITYAQLVERMQQLRHEYGDAVYGKTGRQ